MLLVNYGRQVIFHNAGNVVQCRYCRFALDAPGGRLRCRRNDSMENRRGRCTSFTRAPGSDDDLDQADVYRPTSD